MQTFKQSTPLLMGLLLFVITSCKKTDVPSDMLSVTSNYATAARAATTNNIQQTIDLSGGALGIGPCNNEELFIKSGILKTLTVVTQNDQAYSVTEHVNTANFKLVGPTGIEYTGSQESTFHESYPFSNALYERTVTLSIVLTAHGGGGNIYLKGNWHITIDATGKVTSFIDNFRIGCE